MLAVADIIKLVVHNYTVPLSQPVQAGLLTLHYSISIAQGQWSIADAATQAAAMWLTRMPPCMSLEAVYYGIEGRVIRGADQGMVAWGRPTTTAPGTRTGALMPTQVALVLTKLTALAGRRFRGRCYVPFPSAADITQDSSASGAFLTAVSNNLPAAIQGFSFTKNAGNDILQGNGVLFNRATGIPTIITSVSNSAKWGTQRRRGQYGRSNPVPAELK